MRCRSRIGRSSDAAFDLLGAVESRILLQTLYDQIVVKLLTRQHHIQITRLLRNHPVHLVGTVLIFDLLDIGCRIRIGVNRLYIHADARFGNALLSSGQCLHVEAGGKKRHLHTVAERLIVCYTIDHVNLIVETGDKRGERRHLARLEFLLRIARIVEIEQQLFGTDNITMFQQR